MDRTITVGQLRQNPTDMIRAVRAGERWVLTDRGAPVAEIIPHRPPQWVASEDVDSLLKHLGPDPALLAELESWRASEAIENPWTRT